MLRDATIGAQNAYFQIVRMDGLADGRVDGPTPVQAVQAYRQTDIIIPRVRFAQRRKEGKRKRYRVFRKNIDFFHYPLQPLPRLHIAAGEGDVAKKTLGNTILNEHPA